MLFVIAFTSVRYRNTHVRIPIQSVQSYWCFVVGGPYWGDGVHRTNSASMIRRGVNQRDDFELERKCYTRSTNRGILHHCKQLVDGGVSQIR